MAFEFEPRIGSKTSTGTEAIRSTAKRSSLCEAPSPGQVGLAVSAAGPAVVQGLQSLRIAWDATAVVAPLLIGVIAASLLDDGLDETGCFQAIQGLDRLTETILG